MGGADHKKVSELQYADLADRSNARFPKNYW